MVVIGGSAGSLEVILKMAEALPTKAAAVFVIVVHRKSDGDSILGELLSLRTSMPVKEVEDKEPVVLNTIYLAPCGYHLLLEDKHNFSLDSSEKVHHSRPSIDVTFESVAEVYGDRAIGVLLSGANADGAAGLQKIKQAGGHTIVQDPASAEVDYMPRQGISRGGAEVVIPADALGAYLRKHLG